MKHVFLVGAGLLVGALAMCPVAFGQNGENTKRLDGQESAFLRQAAQDDIFEQRLGQYAAEHGDTEEVRNLGKQMATDHHEDLKAIEQMASDHGLDLEDHDKHMTAQDQTLYDNMTKRPGREFDKEYTKLMVARHNTMVGEYRRERDHAADAAVREYAGKQVEGLEHHVKMSEDAQKVAWKS